MRVEMLLVPDCPNGPVLKERLALALAGRSDVEVAEHVVEDQAEAERRGMHGSPTLLVDGRDPFAAPGTAASVSCRLHRGADGRIGGAPSVEELRQVLGTTATAGADRPPGRTGGDPRLVDYRYAP
ncbi:alkylmercury lyase [Kitasatospora sp. NPDC088548]|uniref:alkylmercury lyase n=1 Tax=Kitasatospora sp. NPDC088548 TaxID=3364075 RepID=UPI0037F444EE